MTVHVNTLILHMWQAYHSDIEAVAMMKLPLIAVLQYFISSISWVQIGTSQTGKSMFFYYY